MQKEVFGKLMLVLTIAIAMLTIFSTFVLAQEASEIICFEDTDCASLGDTWVCDLDFSECVDLDLDTTTTTSSTDDQETTTEADAVSCTDGLDNDADGFIDSDDPDCWDSDGDGVLDAVDQCAGFDDAIDLDLDGIPDDCQTDGQETEVDSDGDGVIDSEDLCEGYDDHEDYNQDGIPDACESSVQYDDSALQASISGIDGRVSDLETSIDNFTTSIEELTNTVGELNTNVQLLSTDQYQLERNVEEKVNTIESQVSTGLAVLQQDIETTKSEVEGTKEEVRASEAKASFFRTASVVAAMCVILAALGYFLKTHQREEDLELSDEVKHFITSQIKRGFNQQHIVAALVKSGWSDHDANWAFEHTTVHNYNQFLKSQGKEVRTLPKHKPTSAHYQKIAVISILSVVIIAAMLFFVKKSVGFAVYYEGISTEDLNALVEERLEAAIELNAFYPLIDYAEVCIQIEDEQTDLSFNILKTPYGNTIESVETMCDENSLDYDFAVKFTSYSVFDALSSSMTCTGFESAHAIQSGSIAARGMYVLPSYYVGDGLTAVDGVDYSDYCAALSVCLSDADFTLIGIDC